MLSSPSREHFTFLEKNIPAQVYSLPLLKQELLYWRVENSLLLKTTNNEMTSRRTEENFTHVPGEGPTGPVNTMLSGQTEPAPGLAE